MRNPKHKLEGTVDNVHLRIGRRHNVGNAAGVLLNLQVGDIANRQKTTQDRMLVSHLKQRRYLGGIREASGLLRQIKKAATSSATASASAPGHAPRSILGGWQWCAMLFPADGGRCP